MRKPLKMLALLTALLMLISAVPFSALAEDVTLRMSWWGGDARHEAILKVIELFQEQNPGVKIEAEYSAFAQYRDKFNIQLTSGASADIMAVDQPWADGIIASGDYFLDLSQYPELIDMAAFDDFIVDNFCQYGDKVFFVAGGINGMGSLVDFESLKEYGLTGDETTFTWDDLIALGKKVHEANPEQYLCCVDSKQAALYYARVYLRQLTGRQLINDDGTMGCTREELAEALGLVDTLYKESIFQPIAESGVYNNTMTQNPSWIDRNMFMILGRTSVMTDMSARLVKEDGSYTTQGFLMPSLEGGVESGIEVRPSILYAISKNCAAPEVAVKFLSFMFTNTEAVKVLKANYSIPASEKSREIANEAGVLDEASFKNVEYSLANAGSMLNSWSSNTEVEAMFTEIMEKIAYGQYSDMLEAADEVIDRIADIVESNS